MKNLRFLVSVAGTLACAGLMSACGSQRVEGKITVADGQHVSLTDATGQAFDVAPGLATVELTWAMGFNNELHVMASGHLLKIPVYRECYLTQEDFYISTSQSKQPVDIYAHKAVVNLGTTQAIHADACFSPGVCLRRINDVARYVTALDCPGVRNDLYETTTYVDNYEVKMLPAGSNTQSQALATFQGEGNTTQTSRFVAAQSDCIVPTPSAAEVVITNANADRIELERRLERERLERERRLREEEEARRRFGDHHH